MELKRIDGYLCIDNCERQLAHQHIQKKEQYWVTINGQEYYYKPTDRAIYEVIGYHAANMFGIEACPCDLATLNGKKGIVSKSLRRDGVNLISGNDLIVEYMLSSMKEIRQLGLDIQMLKYWPAELLGLIYVCGGLSEEEVAYIKQEIGDVKVLDKNTDIKELAKKYAYYFNNLKVIERAIVHRYGDKIDITKIMHQIILMYFFTVYLNDYDRVPGDWLIEDDGHDISLKFIDFEFVLERNLYQPRASFRCGFNYPNTVIGVDITNYLSGAPEEYKKIFREMYDIMLDDFEKVVMAAELQIGIQIPDNEKDMIFAEVCSHMWRMRNAIMTGMKGWPRMPK